MVIKVVVVLVMNGVRVDEGCWTLMLELELELEMSLLDTVPVESDDEEIIGTAAVEVEGASPSVKRLDDCSTMITVELVEAGAGAGTGAVAELLAVSGRASAISSFIAAFAVGLPATSVTIEVASSPCSSCACPAISAPLPPEAPSCCGRKPCFSVSGFHIRFFMLSGSSSTSHSVVTHLRKAITKATPSKSTVRESISNRSQPSTTSKTTVSKPTATKLTMNEIKK